MATLQLTPVELHLVAAAVNEKIAWLNSEYRRLRLAADEADAYTMYVPEMDTNRTMLAVYTAIVRRVEQALDVPFVSDEDAKRALVEDGTVVVPGGGIAVPVR